MQPLSRVRPPPQFLGFGNDDTMSLRPKIAVKVAECIAKWADAESMLGMLLALLLEADAKAVLAMYSALENRSAQMRMLNAAAQSKLPVEHFDVFAALLLVYVRPAMRERDKLAHWCWGYSTELSDALLLMEPDEKTSLHVGAINPPKPIQFDRTKIFVVDEDDMTRMVQRMLYMIDRLADFTGTVWKQNTPEQRAALLQKLSTEPQIQKAVDRRKENRSKTQASPSPSPEPADDAEA
jgi:hypothetical protein